MHQLQLHMLMPLRLNSITPSARRLVTSLRDIGHSASTAAADLVDNSVSAGASTVRLDVVFDGLDSRIIIADDGGGMTENELLEALRFGTRREYEPGDLGRYGLGLKTASLSLGRRLTVVTRRAPQRKRLYSRVMDLDHIERTDRWEILDGRGSPAYWAAAPLLDSHPGTVLVIEELDRLLPATNPESGWARRRFTTLQNRLGEYLGMVFHRLIDNDNGSSLDILVNGEPVRSWNPFAPGEASIALDPRRLEVETDEASSYVDFRGYVLPPRERFSDQEAFERLGGPGRWNRQQGLYVYRAGRMIQSGGWSGLRAADEHTKLARAAVDFGTELDDFFRIDIAKMRVALPAQVRKPLERPIRELCHRAQVEYRSGHAGADPRTLVSDAHHGNGNGNGRSRRSIALALALAAIDVEETDALERIAKRIRSTDPEIAESLGW